jgi:hypothetical protein
MDQGNRGESSPGWHRTPIGSVGAPRRKFTPILRKGEWSNAAPSWLLGSLYLDFRDEGEALDDVYEELLETLHGRRDTPPPVGSPPLPKHHREGRRDISTEDWSLDVIGSSGSAPDEGLRPSVAPRKSIWQQSGMGIVALASLISSSLSACDN